MFLKSFAVFILLFIIVTVHSSNGLCTDYTEFGKCKQITDMFEKALLKQESNIFALQNLFYPSNGHPASNFIVKYKVILPLNSTQMTIRGWSKSNAYTQANPVMLETLFVGLTYAYHMKISRQNTPSMTFILNITEHNYTLTDNEINYGINYITPWLKLYAKKEFQMGKLGYVDEEKGYMYNILDYNWFLTITTIMVTIAALLTSTIILYKLMSIKPEQAATKITFFYAFIFVALTINLVDIIIEAYELYMRFIIEEKYKTNTPSILNKILSKTLTHKLIEMIIGLIIVSTGGLITVVLACLSKQPKPLNCFCCYFMSGNLFYFTYTLGLNIVPTFIMLFITPIETISVVIFFGTMLLSAVMGLAVIILHFKKTRRQQNKKICTAVVSTLLYFIILFSVIPLMAIFLKMLASVHTSNTSYFAPLFLSLGSTIFPILIGYVSKRILSNNTNKVSLELGERSNDKTDSDTSNNEMKPLVTRM